MVTGIIGRKVGMTQLFDKDGTVQPATVLKAGPCVVVQAKNAQSDGYEAVQLGLVEEKVPKVNKAIAGHFKKANVPPTRVRREVTVAKGAEAPKAGEQVLVGALFAAGERVDVIATSRGLGFRVSSSATTLPEARRRTARCSIGRRARLAPARIRRESSRACVRPGTWATGA